MSRGPGQLQRFILDEVERVRQPMLLNKLIWDVATQRAGSKLAPSRELSKALYTSFLRAANGLVMAKEIEAQSRRLETLEELIEHYPYKTRSVELRDLRLRLLPHLKRLPIVSRFNTSENEDFQLRYNAAPGSRWLSLRTRLLEAVRGLSSSKVAHLHAHLIVRGDALFSRETGIKHPGSFVDMANRLAPFLDQELAQELIRFCDETWPPNLRNRLALKSQLYAWVNFGANSKPTLKPEAREALREFEPDIIKGLVIEIPVKGLFELMHTPDSIRHKPLLDKLLQRDALSPFEFLGAPGTFEGAQVATPTDSDGTSDGTLSS